VQSSAVSKPRAFEQVPATDRHPWATNETREPASFDIVIWSHLALTRNCIGHRSSGRSDVRTDPMSMTRVDRVPSVV
jgi:hypothetical protein